MLVVTIRNIRGHIPYGHIWYLHIYRQLFSCIPLNHFLFTPWPDFSYTDVYWFKEGVEDTDAIESDDKYEVTSQDDRHTLEIFFASAEDSGQYLCLAKNDVTSSHWLFGLAVEGKCCE